MLRLRICAIIAVLILVQLWTNAFVRAAPTIFVAATDRLIRLDDRNNDGDYLDPFESRLYADSLPPIAGRIVASSDRVWIVVTGTSRILVVADLNGDDDALDVGEQSDFAVVAAQPPAAAPTLLGIALADDDALFVSDSANGFVFRVQDRNDDGDALDFGESIVVATGFIAPHALSVRPDGSVLVLHDHPTEPVRILIDRNADGDFLDFAENLAYAQSVATAADICAPMRLHSWTTHSTAGIVSVLIDHNEDDDALDPNEFRLYADDLQSPSLIAADSATNDLFIAIAGPSASIIRIRDINGDGDALDVGEVIPVAASLPAITGIALPRNTGPCPPGDANADGLVNIADIPAFAAALTNPAVASPCPLDMNGDEMLDGRDIQPFIEKLIQ